MVIRRSLLMFSAMLTLLLSGCEKETIYGNGPVLEEFRTAQHFTKISVSGSTGVKVSKGNFYEVKLKAYSNLLPHFESRVVNGELHLGYRNGVNVRHDNLEVHIVMPELNALNISGSSAIDVYGTFPQTQQINCRISGSGEIYLEDLQANNFISTISGSGEILAYGLRSVNAEINISGSGIAEVFASDHLRANISGSGTIFYRGNPTVNSTISGNGRVIPQ